MKKKLFSVLSLSAIAMTAISLTSCGLSDEELFESNTKHVLLSNIGPAGAGANYVVTGELQASTAFTDEFIEKGGKVSWSSSNAALIDANKFNEGVVSVPINKPDFGSETVKVEITATVTMGSFVKDVQWDLLIKSKQIENNVLKSIINSYFFAREGSEGSNAADQSAIKINADGSNMIALFVQLYDSTATEEITSLVTDKASPEFVKNSASKRLFVNILKETNADIVKAAASDIRRILGTSVGSKSIYDSIKEIAETGKLDGIELSSSDKNAIKNLGIVELLNSIIEKLSAAGLAGSFTTITAA